MKKMYMDAKNDCYLRALLVKDHGNAVWKLGLLWHRHNVINLNALRDIHAQIMGSRERRHVFQGGRIEDAYDGLGTTDENEAFVDTNAVGVAGTTLHPLVEQTPWAELNQMTLSGDGICALRADSFAAGNRTKIIVT